MTTQDAAMMDAAVTLTFTIGCRPAALARTLQHLAPLLDRHPVVAINDFGDPETSEVFRALCPAGRLIADGIHRGHHGAMDRLMAEVATPLVLHGEDDWLFHRTDFLPQARTLLAALPAASQVCLRDLGDFSARDVDPAAIRWAEAGGLRYGRIDHLHDQWFGFTFNPGLWRADLIRQAGGFGRFAKERHLSRHLRRQGRFVAFLSPGACGHMHDQAPVTKPAPPTWITRLRGALGRG